MSETCAICLDALDPDGRDVHGLDCEHTFHSSCLISWLQSRRTDCPVCRQDSSNNFYEHSDSMSVAVRAKYLRQRYGRRRHVPEELARRISAVKAAEERARIKARGVREYRAEHREALRGYERLRREHYTARRRAWRAERLLGVYQDANEVLPSVTLLS
tara:strand:+ start:513 stop:989 length:477 start_codon:yes stop_codon:yes gene_type:complete